LFENGLWRKRKLKKKAGWYSILKGYFSKMMVSEIIYVLSFPATAPFSIPGFGNNFSLVMHVKFGTHLDNAVKLRN